MRAKNLCLLLVISFPYFITRLLTPRCASRGMIPFLRNEKTRAETKMM